MSPEYVEAVQDPEFLVFGPAPGKARRPEKGKSPREIISPIAIYRAGPATPYVNFD
jgi:hypothetical protein